MAYMQDSDVYQDIDAGEDPHFVIKADLHNMVDDREPLNL